MTLRPKTGRKVQNKLQSLDPEADPGYAQAEAAVEQAGKKKRQSGRKRH